MDAPVERHQLVILNPDLAGLFTAYLAQRAGLNVAILDELRRWRISQTELLQAFPADGTFRPQELDALAVNAGFSPPLWQRVPRLELRLSDQKITVSADGGIGGLILAVAEPFRVGRSILLSWLQDEISKVREYLSFSGRNRPTSLRRVETSVADSVLGLRHPDPDPFIILLDTLCIITLGRGAVQVDIRDFHLVLAGLVNGWHAPLQGDRSWSEILHRRLLRDGARYKELESVTAIQSFGKRSSVVRGSDGSLVAAQILVVPEGDRFHHPLTAEVGTIRWHNWYGKFTTRPDGPISAGVIRPDPKRSPLNDNFITWCIGEKSDNRFVVSAPLESRFLQADRIENTTSRVKFVLGHRLNWQIAELESAPVARLGPPISLPGTTPAVSYPEGPLWGDDILSRLKAADRLSRRIVESFK